MPNLDFATHIQDGEKIHVFPEDDTIEHILFDRRCPCGPQVEKDNDGVIYGHHSLDGREIDVIKELDTTV